MILKTVYLNKYPFHITIEDILYSFTGFYYNLSRNEFNCPGVLCNNCPFYSLSTRSCKVAISKNIKPTITELFPTLENEFPEYFI